MYVRNYMMLHYYTYVQFSATCTVRVLRGSWFHCIHPSQEKVGEDSTMDTNGTVAQKEPEGEEQVSQPPPQAETEGRQDETPVDAPTEPPAEETVEKKSEEDEEKMEQSSSEKMEQSSSEKMEQSSSEKTEQVNKAEEQMDEGKQEQGM